MRCSFSPDGTRLATTGRQSVRLWNPQTGELVRSFSLPAGTVNACSFASECRSIVASSDDGRVRIWDIQAGGEATPAWIEGRVDPVPAASYSRRWPDRPALVSRGRGVRLWLPDAGRQHWELGEHRPGVSAAAISPDAWKLITGSADGSLTVWYGNDSDTVANAHRGRVTACAFSPNGTLVVSASEDATLKLWSTDTRSRHRLSELALFRGHHAAVNGCAISPEGRRLVSVSSDQSLRIWSLGDRSSPLVLCGHTRTVTACAFSPCGQWVVSASEDATIKLWETESGRERAWYYLDEGAPVGLDWAGSGVIAIATASGAIELLRIEQPEPWLAVIPDWHLYDKEILFTCPVCSAGTGSKTRAEDGTVTCRKCRRRLRLSPVSGQRGVSLKSAVKRSMRASDKSKTFKEFVRSRNPTTHSDKHLVISAWLHEVENETQVDSDSVAALYRRAGWRLNLANPRIPFRELQSRGLGSWRHGRFSINQLGLEAAERMGEDRQ